MSSENGTFWSALDGVAVINLDERKDRWDRLEAEAARVGIPKLKRISAVNGKDLAGYGKQPWFRGRKRDAQWAARVGCTLSHRSVMDFARQEDWKTFLVLEDDVDLKSLREFNLEEMSEVLFTRQKDWDICYLGFSKTIGKSLSLCDVGSRKLCQIFGCYTTHAYLVRAPARDWIFEQLPCESSVWKWHARHRIIDRWYSQQLSRHHRVYALAPSLITQHSNFSDILQREVNYDEEFLGDVESASSHRLVFELHNLWTRVSVRLTGLYDCLRGFGKRIRGF